jgi:hypothetical protein
MSFRLKKIQKLLAYLSGSQLCHIRRECSTRTPIAGFFVAIQSPKK